MTQIYGGSVPYRSNDKYLFRFMSFDDQTQFLNKIQLYFACDPQIIAKLYEGTFSRLTLHDFLESAFHPTKISHVGAM